MFKLNERITARFAFFIINNFDLETIVQISVWKTLKKSSIIWLILALLWFYWFVLYRLNRTKSFEFSFEFVLCHRVCLQTLEEKRINMVKTLQFRSGNLSYQTCDKKSFPWVARSFWIIMRIPWRKMKSNIVLSNERLWKNSYMIWGVLQFWLVPLKTFLCVCVLDVVP